MSLRRALSCEKALIQLINAQERDHRSLTVRNFMDASHTYLISYAEHDYFVKVVWGVLSPLETLAPEIHNMKLMPVHKSEPLITQLLNDLILKTGLSPHIVRMYDTWTCSASDKMITHIRKMKKVEHLTIEYRVRNPLLLKKFQIIVMEKLNFSLRDAIQDSKMATSPLMAPFIQSILFQVAWTLYCIQQLFPHFMHNDLHAGNIMITGDYAYDPAHQKFIAYHLGDETYYVPFFGMMTKIIDFGYSSIPDRGIMSLHHASPGSEIPIIRNDFNFLLQTILYLNPDLISVCKHFAPKLEAGEFVDKEFIQAKPNYAQIIKRMSIYRKYVPADESIVAEHGQNLPAVRKKAHLKNNKNANARIDEIIKFHQKLQDKKHKYEAQDY